jgi:hypothetical protein
MAVEPFPALKSHQGARFLKIKNATIHQITCNKLNGIPFCYVNNIAVLILCQGRDSHKNFKMDKDY